jgi:hypothetical protein
VRAAFERRFRELMDEEDASALRQAGQFEYFTLRKPEAEVAAIYRRPLPAAREGERPESERIDPNGDYELVLDPL